MTKNAVTHYITLYAAHNHSLVIIIKNDRSMFLSHLRLIPYKFRFSQCL